MNHAKRVIVLLIPILIILLSSGLNIPSVYAYGQVALGINLLTNHTYEQNDRPQVRFLVHSSGKACSIYLTKITGGNGYDLYISVVGATGALEAQTKLNALATMAMAICEYDSDEVLIMCQANTELVAYRYNINTYAYNTYTHASDGQVMAKASNIYKYVNDWYYICLSYTGVAYIIKFSAANAITKAKDQNLGFSSNTTTPQEIFTFQDDNNKDKVYCLFGYSYPCTYGLWVADLDAPTVTAIANLPLTGYSAGNWNNGDTDYSAYATQLSGGIYPVSTFYYVYFTYTFSDLTGYASGVRKVNIVTSLMKFNNTIGSATLLNNVMVHTYETDRSGSTSVSPGYNTGYAVIDGVKHDYYVFFQDIYSSKYQSMGVFEITDITALSVNYDSSSVYPGVDNTLFMYVSTEGMIYKDFRYPFSYHQVDATVSYICTFESTTIADYSMTVAFTPIDSPQLTNKDYDYTFTIYLNNVIDTNTNDTYILMLDGVERGSGILELTGYFVFRMRVLTAGTHVFIVKVYNGAGELMFTSDDYSYSFTATTTSTTPVDPGTITTGWTNIFTVWLPIMLIVVAPMLFLAIIGGKYGGGTGMLIGMLGGGFAGVIGGTQVNLLPPYILYLYILLMGVVLVLGVALGGKGGGE